MLTLERSTYLGPATVLQAAGNRIRLELPDELAWAVSALAFPYQPVAGDVVLAVGHSGNWYVIGVLKGSGPTTFTAPADLELRAPHGRITLKASAGVDLHSPEVRVHAGRFELLAKSLFERVAEATRWVKDALQVRAGRVRTRVEGDHDLAAGRILQRAENDVKIDGEKIHLG